MHGGLSLPGGAKHPRCTHGLYSKYTPQGRQRLADLERRRQARARIRQIEAMSRKELRAEARLILGPVPLWFDLEELRGILIDQAKRRRDQPEQSVVWSSLLARRVK